MRRIGKEFGDVNDKLWEQKTHIEKLETRIAKLEERTKPLIAIKRIPFTRSPFDPVNNFVEAPQREVLQLLLDRLGIDLEHIPERKETFKLKDKDGKNESP